jgi:hypothetical protein
MLGCAETRPAVCRIMAGWNQQPLVAALTSQQVWVEAHLMTPTQLVYSGSQPASQPRSLPGATHASRLAG